MDSWGRLRCWTLFAFYIFLLLCAVDGSIQLSTSKPLTNVLVLDIDGTVYDDDCHIESQIRDNCHIFSSTFGYTAAESEELHLKYGSTIRGICENGEPRIKFLEYYNEVYPNLDMSLLRKYSATASKGSTGYSVEMGSALRSLHNMDCPIVVASNSPVFHVKRVLTRLGLSKLKVEAFITPERRGGITKNEAKFWDPLFELFPKDRFLCTLLDDNALNVALVRELGMRALRITAGLPLPEALVHFMNYLPAHCSESPSLNPSATNKGVIDTENFDFNEMSYLEAKNEVDKKSFNQEILTMLSKQLNDRIHQRFLKKSDGKNFPLVAVDLGAGLLNMLPTVQKLFSDASATLIGNNEMELQYIAFENNKNIEKHTIKKLTEQLGFESIPSSVDLTANTASTIRADIKSFKKIIKMPAGVNGKKERTMVVTVHLVAEDFMSENALKILNDVLGNHRCSNGKKVNSQDKKYTKSRSKVDLFVGCCVADLISPSALANQILEMAGDGGGLLYLPITFCGQTKIFRNSKELQIIKGLETGLIQESSPRSVRIPDDSEVFSLYHKHLEKMGHYLGPDRLLSELEAYGYSVLLPSSSNNVKSATSNWKISKKKNPYMWKCMVRFIALGTAFQAMGIFDLKSWFNNLNNENNKEDCDMMIDVSNIDILAVLPEIVQKILSPEEMIQNALKLEASHDALMCTDFGSPAADAFRKTPLITRLPSSAAIHISGSENKAEKESEIASKLELFVPTSRSSVEFLSPGVVHVVEEAVPAIGNDQLLVRTTCSLVSTGTELKIFTGDLDVDQPADLTISGMEDKMSYPLRYGYSSVGRVVAVGKSLNEADWMGKLVFSFSPHSTAVVVDASSVMIVPKGILPEDAVFLPSVETAISLIQAARPNIGEKILVVGQGLIGLLTGAVLTHHLSNTETTICDVSEKRLNVASLFNNKALLWNPSLNKLDGRSDYDLSIEVSGNPKGLQTAIDSTGTNGRIVVGSWYGEKPTPLKLGLKFHRSGLQLITSQVSNIHPELSGRWNKIRRFNLTWETLKQIKPSKLISSIASLKSDEVLAAYMRLQKGEDVTVLFRND